MTLFDYRDELDRFDARARASSASATHVRVLGPLPPDEIERLYRAADVFAFPSVKEGFGLAALEALAAELPVVASDLDVFRGFLADGESALLDADRRRRGAGARAARGSRATASCARGCARAGARVAREYTWDAAAAAHERAYRDVPGDRERERALMATRSRSPRAGAAATRPTSTRAGTGSRSTSPRRAGGERRRHDADRGCLRRAGELLLPRARARRPPRRHRAPRPARRRDAPSAPAASCATAASSSRRRPTSPATSLAPLVERARRVCWVSNTLAEAAGGRVPIHWRSHERASDRDRRRRRGHRRGHHRQAGEPRPAR